MQPILARELLIDYITDSLDIHDKMDIEELIATSYASHGLTRTDWYYMFYFAAYGKLKRGEYKQQKESIRRCCGAIASMLVNSEDSVVRQELEKRGKVDEQIIAAIVSKVDTLDLYVRFWENKEGK